MKYIEEKERELALCHEIADSIMKSCFLFILATYPYLCLLFEGNRLKIAKNWNICRVGAYFFFQKLWTWVYRFDAVATTNALNRTEQSASTCCWLCCVGKLRKLPKTQLMPVSKARQKNTLWTNSPNFTLCIFLLLLVGCAILFIACVLFILLPKKTY